MKQNSQSSISAMAQKVLPHLRNPMKLKLLLCCTLGGGWYAGYFAPLSEELLATKALIAKERQRVNAAREIERIKAKLAPLEKAIPTADAADFMRHIVNHIRSTPIKVIDVRPEKPKDIGPFTAPGLRLTLQGRYEELDDLLAWVERDNRMLRVDSIKLNRSSKNKSHLLASVLILGLHQKPVDTAKADAAEKTATKGSPAASKTSTKQAPPKVVPKSPTATKTSGAAVGKPLAEARKKVGDIRKQLGAAASAAQERKPADSTSAKPQ